MTSRDDHIEPPRPDRADQDDPSHGILWRRFARANRGLSATDPLILAELMDGRLDGSNRDAAEAMVAADPDLRAIWLQGLPGEADSAPLSSDDVERILAGLPLETAPIISIIRNRSAHRFDRVVKWAVSAAACLAVGVCGYQLGLGGSSAMAAGPGDGEVLVGNLLLGADEGVELALLDLDVVGTSAIEGENSR